MLEFETDDPELRGEITMTTTIADGDGGTDVLIEYPGMPSGVNAADNEAGTRMSPANLAALVGAGKSQHISDSPARRATTWSSVEGRRPERAHGGSRPRCSARIACQAGPYTRAAAPHWRSTSRALTLAA